MTGGPFCAECHHSAHTHASAKSDWEGCRVMGCSCDGFRDRMPVLPYDDDGRPSSGWSGSETSHDRAKNDDESGRTAKRQRVVLAYLNIRGTHGATVRETRNALGLHHGQASGVLSNLHKGKRIARLSETRDRCRVYVALDFVGERETETPGRRRKVAP